MIYNLSRAKIGLFKKCLCASPSAVTASPLYCNRERSEGSSHEASSRKRSGGVPRRLRASGRHGEKCRPEASAEGSLGTCVPREDKKERAPRVDKKESVSREDRVGGCRPKQSEGSPHGGCLAIARQDKKKALDRTKK